VNDPEVCHLSFSFFPHRATSLPSRRYIPFKDETAGSSKLLTELLFFFSPTDVRRVPPAAWALCLFQHLEELPRLGFQHHPMLFFLLPQLVRAFFFSIRRSSSAFLRWTHLPIRLAPPDFPLVMDVNRRFLATRAGFFLPRRISLDLVKSCLVFFSSFFP